MTTNDEAVNSLVSRTNDFRRYWRTSLGWGAHGIVDDIRPSPVPNRRKQSIQIIIIIHFFCFFFPPSPVVRLSYRNTLGGVP